MKLSIMDTIEQEKEVYARPEAEAILIAMQKSIVQDISKPVGTTDPLDPIEG